MAASTPARISAAVTSSSTVVYAAIITRPRIAPGRWREAAGGAFDEGLPDVAGVVTRAGEDSQGLAEAVARWT